MKNFADSLYIWDEWKDFVDLSGVTEDQLRQVIARVNPDKNGWEDCGEKVLFWWIDWRGGYRHKTFKRPKRCDEDNCPRCSKRMFNCDCAYILSVQHEIKQTLRWDKLSNPVEQAKRQAATEKAEAIRAANQDATEAIRRGMVSVNIFETEQAPEGYCEVCNPIGDAATQAACKGIACTKCLDAEDEAKVGVG